MRLRQIFEAPAKTASFAIGRLNPATIGHERLVDAIKSQPGDHFLFLTDRAPKLPDDPLGPQEKLEWAKQSFDGIQVRLAKSVAIAANQLYRLGYTEVTFLEGEDKLYNMLMQYNGQTEGKRGPIEFPFKFDKIKYVKLERNADDPGAAGMSATKLRSYAADGNYEMFTQGITKKAQPQAKALYNTLRTAMNVSNNEDINEIAFAPALPYIAPIAMPVIGMLAREGGKRLLKALGIAAMSKATSDGLDINKELENIAPGIDTNTKIEIKDYDDAIKRIARNPQPPSNGSKRKTGLATGIDELIANLIKFLGENLLKVLIAAGLTIAAIYAIGRTIKYFRKKHDEKELRKTIQDEIQKAKDKGDVKESDINELNLFKKADSNTSIKAQDPNKLKVLDWVASRTDGQEHFLSFYRKGAAWSGKLLFIRPDQAKRFMQKVEANDDYLPQIKQALTNIATAGKLFDRFGVKYQIRRAE